VPHRLIARLERRLVHEVRSAFGVSHAFIPCKLIKLNGVGAATDRSGITATKTGVSADPYLRSVG